MRRKCLGLSLVGQAPVASPLLSKVTMEGKTALKKAPHMSRAIVLSAIVYVTAGNEDWACNATRNRRNQPE